MKVSAYMEVFAFMEVFVGHGSLCFSSALSKHRSERANNNAITLTQFVLRAFAGQMLTISISSNQTLI
jgi:hypothetical protein